MKEYIVILQGCGGGCDYTIGCNINYKIVSANNLEEAKKHIWNHLEDWYSCSFDFDEYTGEDPCIEYFLIAELVNHFEEPVQVREPIMEAYKKYLEIVETDRDRKEYERLKEKFENE